MERKITCSIDGCDSSILARGWCRKHYLRWYKHGSTDVCKQAKDYVKKGSDSVNFKHGRYRHPLYKTWVNMMSRCYDNRDDAYRHYGARGILVCNEWHDINRFIEDMGDRPKGLSLERVDNNKGYSANNCKWATASVQVRNRRCTKLTEEKANEIRTLPRKAKNGRGDGYTRLEIAEMYGVSVATVKKVLSGEYWR